MRMKRYVINFVAYVHAIQGSKENCYSVPGSKAVHPKKAGCNCGVCDIWNKYEMTDFYYYIECSAGE